jgi:hypothetical protein
MGRLTAKVALERLSQWVKKEQGQGLQLPRLDAMLQELQRK